jgi:heptosyltransferase-2
VRKILVVNMNYMGDALMTTPAITALRRAYPDAQIDTVVGEGAPADVLQGNGDIDNIIVRTARDSWGRCVQIYRLLREGRYTDAIILPALSAYAIAAFVARTPVRVGLANRGMNHLLTHPMPTTSAHMADSFLDTVDVPQSAKATQRRLAVVVDPRSREYAEKLLLSKGIDPERPLVAVNLGATRPQKRWFVESFAELVDRLADVQTLLVGAGAEDLGRAKSIIAAATKTRPVNLVNDTSVKQLAGVLERCDLVISADSGPMHLATAVGTPVLALFGSTDPAETGPYDAQSRSIYKALSCAPCKNHPTCSGRFDCMRAITADEVAAIAHDMLREGTTSSMVKLPMAEVVPRGETREDLNVLAKRTDPHSALVGQSRNGTGEPTASGAEFKRILIATKFRFIGDTLLAIPIFRAARERWPNARIVLLTGKNARLLLQNNPYLDEIIEFDPYRADSGQKAFWRLVRRLQRARFDLALVLNRSFHSALVPWLGGIGTRAGFESEGRGALLNRRVVYDKEKSEIACYFDVLRAVAPSMADDPALELWVSPQEREAAGTRIAEQLPSNVLPCRSAPSEDSVLVGIQPGASLDGKRWSATRFAAVADQLVESDSRVRIVLVGGPDERGVAEQMMAQCSAETVSKTAGFVGACNLRESLAIVSYLHLFIGNDTAVMHSAVALGVRTVALFGPTNPRKWGNYGDRHRVIESVDGSMDGIAVDNVVVAAQELLAAGAALASASA